MTLIWCLGLALSAAFSMVAFVAATSRPHERVLWLTAVGCAAVTAALGMATGRALERRMDPLTGLRNRMGLLDLTRRLLPPARAPREEGRAVPTTALILLDLEGFRGLNDSLGLRVGDQVLRETAAHLQEWFRATRSDRGWLHGLARSPGGVARLGDDEFAILLTHIPDPRLLEQEVRTLLSELGPPSVVGEWPLLAMEASAGISYHPDHADTAESLLRRADLALRHAQSRRTGLEVYQPTRDNVHTPKRLGLLAELRRALRQDELCLHFQPKVDFNGRTTGLEALVRWESPAHGPMPPSEFVPLAEASALAPHLLGYVLDAALSQTQHWWSQGIRVPVAVNVSARDIAGKGFAAAVLSRLERYGLPPQALELEITERLLVDDWRPAADALDLLRHRGVGVSLDDFGVGYSSLVRLRSLPIDTLKLDHWFVARIAVDEDDAAVVRCSVELAHLLGMRVVAEGVEDRATWGRLRTMGVDAVQGWLISPALPAQEIPNWLREHSPALVSASSAARNTQRGREPSPGISVAGSAQSGASGATRGWPIVGTAVQPVRAVDS